MNIYDDNGYLDFNSILKVKVPFIWILGGRGTGKTYGALQYCYDHNINFMFMRNTQTQIKKLVKPQFNPFKKLNSNKVINVLTDRTDEDLGFFYEATEEDKKIIGTLCALSTVGNLRGFDASDCKILIWDEFIPQKQERGVKDIGDAFLNAYETINRNRELEGEDPLKVLALSNSNELNNPLFIDLGLVRIAEKMQKKKQQVTINEARGFMIINLYESPISEKKKETALYKFSSSNSSYYKMAIENDYNLSSDELVRPQPLKEYKPIVNVGELCIYEHKSDRRYYVCDLKQSTASSFGSDEIALKRFKNKYLWLYVAHMQQEVYFQDYSALGLFEKYIK